MTLNFDLLIPKLHELILVPKCTNAENYGKNKSNTFQDTVLTTFGVHRLTARKHNASGHTTLAEVQKLK